MKDSYSSARSFPGLARITRELSCPHLLGLGELPTEQAQSVAPLSGLRGDWVGVYRVLVLSRLTLIREPTSGPIIFGLPMNWSRLPTGVHGGIVYRGSCGRLLCHENTSWVRLCC